MTDTHYRLPNEVANQLQISPSTLRRWSNEFADYLSETAGRPQPEAGGRQSHRRYSDQDLETLMTIKGLLAEGQTYVQVAKRLEALRLRHSPVDVVLDDEDEDEDAPVTALGPTLQEFPYAPAVTVLADTLHTVADGQQLLLGSQQANREMLSVVLQDNFNLKEENAKLRDRMLDLERDLDEMRRMDEVRRETLEVRLQQIEDEILYRPNPQPRRAQRQGCLSSIFGPLA
jgi:DNA-binding transcriptional MerR regulator